MSFFLLCDNYDEGLDLTEVENEDELRKWMLHPDWGESNRRGLLYVIEGRELDLAEVLGKYE